MYHVFGLMPDNFIFWLKDIAKSKFLNFHFFIECCGINCIRNGRNNEGTVKEKMAIIAITEVITKGIIPYFPITACTIALVLL